MAADHANTMLPKLSSSIKKGCEELSAYELERLENIKTMEAELSDIFVKIDETATEIVLSKIKSNHIRKHKLNKLLGDDQNNSAKRIRRSARIYGSKKSINYNEEEEGNKLSKMRHGSLLIKFPFFKKNQNQNDDDYYNNLSDGDFIDSGDEYDDYERNSKYKRKGMKTSVNTLRLAVSNVTQEMLSNITYSSSGKEYTAVPGKTLTTCHQCRQKTLDQKSICRYKYCRGIRGMFCGFCLGNRYGEDVAEVLLKKKWACPPCRGICNCSICRHKEGKGPTGQLARTASNKGYQSVRHMLRVTEGENVNKELNSDSEYDDKDFIDDEEDKISKSYNNNKSNAVNEQLKTEQDASSDVDKNEDTLDKVSNQS